MLIKDLMVLLVVILLLGIVYAANMYAVGIENIKRNWSKYKCNPTIMPFAGLYGYDPFDNFTQCISQIQSAQIGKHLLPLQSIFGVFEAVLKDNLKANNAMRNKFSLFSGKSTSIFKGIFNSFGNIGIAVQEVIIRMKDMLSKLFATVMLLAHFVDGMQKTGASAWNGPIGKTIRTVGKVCFHEDTSVHLFDGSIKKMRDIEIDDVLEDGSTVNATLKLKGNKETNEFEHIEGNEEGLNDFYKIYDTKHGEYIYVTASHLVYDSAQCKYIPVKDYSLSTHVPEMKEDFLYCLITDTHIIQLGNIKFYDWDDPVECSKCK